jgi:hypothetical protein
MIWLASRRHRLPVIVVGGALIVLGVWMALVAHSFEVALHTPAPRGCLEDLLRCNGLTHGWLAAQSQAGYINLLLLLVPCLFGIALGAPLVAGELQGHTNRLAWTQSISRSRWLVIDWLVVGLSAVVMVALLQVVVQWWSGHVLVNFLETSPVPGTFHLVPRLFGISGIVPVAYTLFAFSLGAALGATFRRTGWAVVGTLVGYGSATALFVFNIRPYHLVSPVFVSNHPALARMFADSPPWILGYGYRFIPGTVNRPGTASANEIGQRCQSMESFLRCLSSHQVVGGTSYQPSNHYWALQWGEAAIYVLAAIALFGLTLWAVRRWKA